MATKTSIEQQKALDILRDQLPQGTTVYTILRKVSASGMSRNISVVVVKNDGIWDVTYMLIRAGLFKRARGNAEGVQVSGTGMDMGFHVVYELSRAIHDDGYALSQRWL